MRRACALLLAALLSLTVAGCSGPEREAQSQQISDEIKAMPGVQSVEHRYQNGIAIGSALWMTVTARPDATGDQLAAVWDRFTSRVHDIGYKDHWVELTVTSCGTGDRAERCGKVVSTVNTHTDDQTAPRYAEWLQVLRGPVVMQADLTTTYPAEAKNQGDPNPQNFTLNIGHPGAPVTAADITAIYTRLATDFGDLPGVGWSVKPEDSDYPSLEVQELPSADLMRLWDGLNAVAPTQARFTLQSTHDDLTSVEPSTRATYLDTVRVDLRDSALPVRDVALKQLGLLKASGRPGTYQAISHESTVTVWLGSCSPPPVPSEHASPLQAELRRQFEAC